jgi:SRSO17 transposase
MVLAPAQQYLRGLIQATRRNVERMAEVVPGTNAQALHHFLSHSPWDARAVMNQVARDVDKLVGGDQDTCLLIDETCFAKKGRKSVGVARQWYGLQGKTENCQVAVFAALVRGRWVSLIDTELYLPKEWVEDAPRCADAGVPAERRVLRTKPQLALEMIERARANGLRFSWVAADGTYGQDRALLRALERAGEIFLCDIHRDQKILLDEPARPQEAPKQERATAVSLRVDEWASQQPAEAWQRVWVRHSTQGELRLEALVRRVWVFEACDREPHEWHLIVTREFGAPETMKFSFSNAPRETPLQRLVHMQRQRYWVERIFQDAKNEAGMDEYQARSWRAWHHHMALVMMAMLFLLRERLLHADDLPLLSARDIKILLARFLPRRDVDIEEVIHQMQSRHRHRQAAIDSSYRRQRRRDRPAAGKVTK